MAHEGIAAQYCMYVHKYVMHEQELSHAQYFDYLGIPMNTFVGERKRKCMLSIALVVLQGSTGQF